jgi:hypothetical protein
MDHRRVLHDVAGRKNDAAQHIFGPKADRACTCSICPRSGIGRFPRSCEPPSTSRLSLFEDSSAFFRVLRKRQSALLGADVGNGVLVGSLFAVDIEIGSVLAVVTSIIFRKAFDPHPTSYRAQTAL